MVISLNQNERDNIIDTILDSVLLQYDFLNKIDNELDEIKKEKESNNLIKGPGEVK